MKYSINPLNVLFNIFHQKFLCTYYPNKWVNMRVTSDLKLYSDGVIFRYAKRPINNSKSKKSSNLYWKCIGTITVLLFSIVYLSWFDKFYMSISTLSILLSFCIFSINSSHLRSAHDNVRKKVGTPNWFTIAKNSDLDFYQYTGVPFFMEL